MTLFEGIQAFITNDSTLAAKLPGGVCPHIIPQGATTFPLLVVRIISGVPEPPTHDEGASTWSTTRIEFTVWGGAFLADEQASILLAALFRPFNGYLGGGTNVRWSTNRVQGPRSCQDPTTRLVGVQIDIIGMTDADTQS
jgi:hypothetical protein